MSIWWLRAEKDPQAGSGSRAGIYHSIRKGEWPSSCTTRCMEKAGNPRSSSTKAREPFYRRHESWADILLAAENYPDDRENRYYSNLEEDAEDWGAPQVDRH